jgi:hypothetical protein
MANIGIAKLFLMAFSIGVIAVPHLNSHERTDDESTRDRFDGAWRLVWLEQEGVDGNIHKADCTGMFVFTRDGHASVQVMFQNPQPAAAAAPSQYAQGGYEASFGKYEIDERGHTFTYHVEGSLVPTLVGKDLTRLYEFSGKQLIVQSVDPKEHWRVAWEHE